MSARPPAWVGRRLLLGAVVLGVSLGAPSVASALPSDPEAARLLEEGQVKYKAEKFGEAIDDFKKGYDIEADPAFLIAWAQAERQRGRCGAAVQLYKRFLATNPPEVAQDFARDGMVRCAEQLAEEESTPPEDDDDDDTEDEDESAEALTTEDDEVEAVESDRERAAWIRDPLGTSLFAVGLLGSGVGTGLILTAHVQQQRLDRDIDDMTINYGEFDDRQRGVRNLRIAGGVVLGAGAALLIGGIVRWAVVGSRAKKANTAVGFTLDREHAGLTISGRF